MECTDVLRGCVISTFNGKLNLFKNIIDDLQNIQVKIEDENKSLLLLSSFPRTFEHVKNVLIYENESIINLDTHSLIPRR